MMSSNAKSLRTYLTLFAGEHMTNSSKASGDTLPSQLVFYAAEKLAKHSHLL
jgi:hypothetical protein